MPDYLNQGKFPFVWLHNGVRISPHVTLGIDCQICWTFFGTYAIHLFPFFIGKGCLSSVRVDESKYHSIITLGAFKHISHDKFQGYFDFVIHELISFRIFQSGICRTRYFGIVDENSARISQILEGKRKMFSQGRSSKTKNGKQNPKLIQVSWTSQWHWI